MIQGHSFLTFVSCFRKGVLLLFFLAIFLNAPSQTATWTWMNGTPLVYVPTPVFGTQGVPSPSNIPCFTYEGAEWTDLNGNFWLMGGSGQYAVMWKFDPLTNEWVWVHGPPTNNSIPVFGIQGVPSPANYPGGRQLGTGTWVGLNGDLWLYGGVGWDAAGGAGAMEDLWKYNIASNTWTWMKGPNLSGMGSNYGIQGVPSPTNQPPVFSESAYTWVDTNGDLWLFSPGGTYDDMWRYSVATNEWTWMSGSQFIPSPPNYGTLQVPAASNTPGARNGHTRWTDAQGNFWLFSGALTIPGGFMPADMWMYNPTTLLWTCMNGSLTTQATTFTQPCVAGGNPEGVFEGRCTWVDQCGRFWAMGGRTNSGTMSYTWFFDPATNQFTWVDGPLAANVPGNIGTVTVPAPTNAPLPVDGHVPYTDANGQFWYFGGSTGPYMMNAMWRYAVVYPTAAMTTPGNGCAPFTALFSSSATGTYTYHWDFGDSSTTADTSSLPSPSWTYTQPGTYTVTLVTEADHACAPCMAPDTSATFVVVVAPPPVVNIGRDTVLCPGNMISLDAQHPGATYLWNTGATTQIIQPDSTGLYAVTVTDGPCSASDTVLLTFVQQLQLPLQVPLCTSVNGVVLDAGNPGATYSWSTGAQTQTILITQPGTYSVTVTNASCVLTATVVAEGIPGESTLYVPNTFTPDVNGLNEVFTGVGEGITSFHMTIFDRWGELIFETYDFTAGWDGTVAGKQVQEATYVYVINYTASCTGTSQLRTTGHVNVLR